MVRDQRVVLAAGRQQRFEGQLVQAAALPGEHLVDERLTGQRVPEAELVVAGLHHQPAPHQVPQRVDELRLAVAGHRREQVERHLAAQHRGRLDDPLLGRVEVVELPPERLRHVPRQRPVAQRVEVLVAVCLDQLFEEERVAAGAVVQ
ncbi:hypothetical protein [Dactylosporangium cerinum]